MKITKKSILNSGKKVYYCGYCALQTVLRYHTPKYHTETQYGWGADIYEIFYSGETVYLVTGYQPFGQYRISYDLCNAAEFEAQTIMQNTRWTEWAYDLPVQFDNILRNTLLCATKRTEIDN